MPFLIQEWFFVLRQPMKRITYIILSLCACTLACAQSAYINKVYEYVPAPGQFINVLPEYTDGDSEADMIRKVEEKIVGQAANTTSYICLGAWGGYVTFGFDHPLVNVTDSADFIVFGNAFLSGTPQDGVQFGSSEPGIIYVSPDENGDGLPNDTWYEIAGSAHAQAYRSCEMVYDNNGLEDISWADNIGNYGYIKRNSWHPQPYFPQWIAEDELIFSGTLLQPNVITVEGAPAPKAYMLDYGYADNWPNGDPRARINLDWAVDSLGQPANLKSVDFIRVQTGVQVDWGVSGEMSTEVCGAEDLHPSAILPVEDALEAPYVKKATKHLFNGRLVIRRDGRMYDAFGRVL